MGDPAVALNALQKVRHVLDVLASRGAMPTYVIRNWLDAREIGCEKKWPHVKTSQVLAVCKRAELLGYVEQARTSYPTMKVWKITNAGRQVTMRGRQ